MVVYTANNFTAFFPKLAFHKLNNDLFIVKRSFRRWEALAIKKIVHFLKSFWKLTERGLSLPKICEGLRFSITCDFCLENLPVH